MELHIDLIELVWIVMNATAVLFTAAALVDAWEGMKIAGPNAARRLISRGNVRRESLRLVVQLLLLSIVVPGLFSDRQTPVTPIVAVLVSIPALLLIQTMFDALERKQLMVILVKAAETEAAAGLRRVEAALEENTKLTLAGTAAAKEAFHEANSTNRKIANLQEQNLLAQQGTGQMSDNAPESNGD